MKISGHKDITKLPSSIEIYGDPGHRIGDYVLAKECAEKLVKAFPSFPLWAVHVNDEKTGGVICIRNLQFSLTYGYVLHLSTVYADPSRQCVIRAGGEILERNGVG